MLGNKSNSVSAIEDDNHWPDTDHVDRLLATTPPFKLAQPISIQTAIKAQGRLRVPTTVDDETGDSGHATTDAIVSQDGIGQGIVSDQDDQNLGRSHVTLERVITVPVECQTDKEDKDQSTAN